MKDYINGYTKEQIIQLIITSKLNEIKLGYTYNQLFRKNRDELEQIYNNFLDREYEAILNDEI